MRGGLCGKLQRPPSQLLFALQQSSIDSQLFVENSQFMSTAPAFDAPVRGSPWEYCHECLMSKNYNGVAGYPKVKKIVDTFIRFDRIHKRDGQTGGQTDRQTDTA